MAASNPWLVRGLEVLFGVAAAGFVVACVGLATVNRFPGSADSMHNLALARGILEGRGLESPLVCQFFEPQALDGPDTLRLPGVPVLLAGLFRVFGVSLAVQVLLNGLVVLGTALCVRAAVRRLAGPALGPVAGLLVLLTGHYELISIWNNGLLTLLTAGLLLVAALDVRERISPAAGALACGALGGIGILFKPSFVLAGAACGLVLLATGPRAGRGGDRLRRLALCAAVMAVVSAPLWLPNLVRHGRLLESSVPALVRAERYGGEDGFGLLPDGTWGTVRYGAPLTRAAVVEMLGEGETLRRDAGLLGEWFLRVFLLNRAVAILAALALPLAVRAGEWRTPALVLTPLAEPFFSGALYNHPDWRYLWPTVPVLVVLACLGVALANRVAPRLRWLMGIALVLAFVLGAKQMSARWSHNFLRQARLPAPGWVEAVRALPGDAVVLSNNPWAVAWWGERKAVMAPTGPRAALAEVRRRYRPTYFLNTRPVGDGCCRLAPTRGYVRKIPFARRDLEPLADGERPWPWRLYRVRPQAPKS